MDSPSSVVKRRAWINSSRQWPTVEDQDPEAPLCNLRSASIADDDVFSDASNLDDDLSLGADASVLNGSEITFEAGVSEVLQMCSEDAEETLYELGFGCDEPQVTVRIPPRFFTFPSQAQGINFRLFLDSQIRRIREEDPSLSLASRFRQVQVLTAMANAFYSLYSHVSRTPLQKLDTPEFTFSSPVERIERFRSSVRSEPRSPVERLKDTVSKMCLYTGSPRGSDSSSPQTSPRKRASLPDVVGAVLKVKTGLPKTWILGNVTGVTQLLMLGWSLMVIKPVAVGKKRETSRLCWAQRFCRREIKSVR
ncbi:Protein TESPA1 Thymocyte-expressed positive selection-associated protein 1 [Channa argus]|uniref:Protein TESPA1 Thymocyte-expressed positive selection-associated protein 1 n=1 Tax=Channa argus TaxID=215402 RepID=A0A6G1PJ92_CHAAH|nr:Protein TESPA1 Thymocyte-expressed positive selection-associated protein 1 [Channa argus]